MKHRGNIYCVVRHSDEGWSHVIGAYKDPDHAQDVVDAYNQDVIDGELFSGFHFQVQITQYYEHG